MKTHIILPAVLLVALHKTVVCQNRQWTVADTALANLMVLKGEELAGSDLKAHTDSAWVLFDRVLEIYAATVGLHHDAPYDALRLKAVIRFWENDFGAAIPLYQECIKTGRKMFGHRGRPLGSAYDDLGVAYGLSGEFEPALYFLKEALATRLIHLGPVHPRTSESYNNIGVALHFRGDLSGAVEYYQKSIAIDRILFKQKKIHATEMADGYRNISITLSESGDSERALANLHLGLEALSDTGGDIKTERLRGLMYRGMASCYSQQGNHLKSIAFFEKAAAHFRANAMAFSPETGLCYSNLSIVFREIGQLQKQEEYIRKALEVWDTLRLSPLPGPVSDIRFGASAIKNLGELKMLQGRLDEAKKHTIEALYWAQEFSSRELTHGTHLQLANIYARSGQADSAGYHFEQAMGGTEWRAAETYWSVKSAPGELALFRFEKARVSADVEAMQQAWREWQRFEQFLLENRSRLTGKDARTGYLTRIRPLIRAAISSARYLNGQTGNDIYLNHAFLLSEKTRALTLFEGLQESNALHFSGVPDSLVIRERNLRLDIARIETQIFNSADPQETTPDSAVLTLINKLYLLKNQADTLQKSFETNYPDYYALKYDLRVEDVAAVQRDLLYPDMALVEYFVGDSAVFIFTIRKQDYSVLEVKKDFPLEHWVAQLRRGMTGFHTDPDMAAQYDSLAALYTEAAANIYEKLVAPIAAKLPAKVIIIPDGVLGYVPFEALLVEKPANPTRWSQHRYLLNDHSVSYCYSATMLREMLYRKHKQQPALNFLGFAPHYDGDTSLLDSLFRYDDNMRKDLKPLPHSGEEVFRGAKMMKGQAMIGAEASKAAFTEKASQARILHLATHGQANDRSGDYCFLVFADQKDSAENEILYARDIYNLRLNAELVTLSACETGIGEMQGGEGIISLARAFAYAGAKSIVTSLWSVSDSKTKDLMLDFYRNLRKGMLKDDALRQAKLDYLKRNRGQAAHPFYWAGFVGVGNMGKVK